MLEIVTSVTSAPSQSVDHLSTVTLVYALLNREITFDEVRTGGVGAAVPNSTDNVAEVEPEL